MPQLARRDLELILANDLVGRRPIAPFVRHREDRLELAVKGHCLHPLAPPGAAYCIHRNKRIPSDEAALWSKVTVSAAPANDPVCAMSASAYSADLET